MIVTTIRVPIFLAFVNKYKGKNKPEIWHIDEASKKMPIINPGSCTKHILGEEKGICGKPRKLLITGCLYYTTKTVKLQQGFCIFSWRFGIFLIEKVIIKIIITFIFFL